MDQPRGLPNPGLDTKGSVFGRAEKPQQQLPPFVLLEFQISSAAAKRAKISIFHPKAAPLLADWLLMDQTPLAGHPGRKVWGFWGIFFAVLALRQPRLPEHAVNSPPPAGAAGQRRCLEADSIISCNPLPCLSSQILFSHRPPGPELSSSVSARRRRPEEPPSAGIWEHRLNLGCAGALILQPELNFPPRGRKRGRAEPSTLG